MEGLVDYNKETNEWNDQVPATLNSAKNLRSYDEVQSFADMAIYPNT